MFYFKISQDEQEKQPEKKNNLEPMIANILILKQN